MVVTNDPVELGMARFVRIFVPSYMHCKSVQVAWDYVRRSTITNMATTHNIKQVSGVENLHLVNKFLWTMK